MKARKEWKFPCAVCSKDTGSNSILCQFCKCWADKRRVCIRGRLKLDGMYTWRARFNQEQPEQRSVQT